MDIITKCIIFSSTKTIEKTKNVNLQFTKVNYNFKQIKNPKEKKRERQLKKLTKQDNK